MSVICRFFGHRNVNESIRAGLYAEIEKHITEKSVDTFYVGGYGQFDGLAAAILHDMKERYPHISVCRVLAYIPTGKTAENYGKQLPYLVPGGA